MNKDKIIRGIDKDKYLRFFAIDCTEALTKANEIHNLSFETSVLIGRLIAASLMMSYDLKDDRNSISLKIKSDGMIKNAICAAKKNGDVKAYINNPNAKIEQPLKNQIQIKDLFKNGSLIVTKDLGMKTPYISEINLIDGELSKDFAYYFNQSEQTPSAVSLGALVNPNGSIRRAGGFIIQLLPDAPEEIITKLENSINNFPYFNDVLDMGKSLEDIIKKMLLKDFEIEIKAEQKIQYKCDCSREKYENALALLPKDDLEATLADDDKIEVVCHFCNTKYHYKNEIIKEILNNK